MCWLRVEAVNGDPEVAVYRSRECAISARFGLERFRFSYGDAARLASPTIAVASGAKIGTRATPAGAVASTGAAATTARIALANLPDWTALKVSMIGFCVGDAGSSTTDGNDISMSHS